MDKKPSLFAQRMMSKKNEKRKINQYQNSISLNVFGDKSTLVVGSDADAIHKENVNKLASLSAEEIEEERNKLLTEMDPALVHFLRNKKFKNKDFSDNSSDNQIKMKAISDNRTLIHSNERSPVTSLINKWPHMDLVEPEKLQWMHDLPPPKPPPIGVPYNARFSFDGNLLEYSEEVRQEGLYHHGEEPERPGYTLQELMQLSRSSILQQRTTAINTLANVFQKASSYTHCLEKPLLSQLLDSEIFLLLRFSLDDNVRQIITAAGAAICNLLVNFEDESCLQRLLGQNVGLKQPLFYVHLDLKAADIAELKDPQLLKLDLIKGALRTHLLSRFSYIMNKLSPDRIESENIVKCLIRICRHSLEAAMAVTNCPGLLSAVRALLNQENGYNCCEAMKLFRLISCHSRILAQQLIDNYTLMEPIQRYIAGESREVEMSLVLESFYTWQSFLAYDLTLDDFLAFSPVITRLLMAHAENTSVMSSSADLELATALVSTISVTLRMHYSSAKHFLPMLHLCAMKWLTQLITAVDMAWPMCKLIGAVLNCSAVVVSQGESDEHIITAVHKFLDSSNFIYSVNNLSKSSWLLCDSESNNCESLPCLGVVPPSLCDRSTLPLIAGLAKYLHVSRNVKLSEKFVSSEGVQNYLKSVFVNNLQNKARHWYARQEVFLLYDILHLHLQTDMCTSIVHEWSLFLALAVQQDDRYLLSPLFHNIIFNPQFFKIDLVSKFENLHLQETPQYDRGGHASLLAEAIANLENIAGCYLSLLGLQGLVPPSLTASIKGVESALPTDWQFIPILKLYNSEGTVKDAVSVAVRSLQWVLLLEVLRPAVASATSVSARFCRLACTFLAGNDLFRDVSDLLGHILMSLLQHNSQLDFDAPIHGLSSFYDFFRQLMEQYSAVSYSNPVFGQYLLVPLQQRHNSKYRKIIWSEQAGILRILSVPVSQLGVPLKEYLEPYETDTDLLQIYLGCLATEKVRENWCPVLYRVAVHHVSMFIKLNSESPCAQYLLQKVQSLGNQNLKTLLLEYNI